MYLKYDDFMRINEYLGSENDYLYYQKKFKS